MMKCWTFEHQKQKTPFFYPPQNGFWMPLYVLLDCNCTTEGHTHEFAEIGIVYHGSARHTRLLQEENKPKDSKITAGDIFGLLPGEYHEISKTGKEWKHMVVLFDPAILGDDWKLLLAMPGLDAILKKRRTLHLSLTSFEEITAVITRLQQELFHHAENYEINLRGLLVDFLIRLGRCPVQEENLKANPHTDKAVQFLRHHWAKKITLDDVARHAGASKTYLCHLFREKMGMSLWDYLNQMRIERAKFYIRTTSNMQISEIASLCGFEDHSYFSKVFRKFEGISPQNYLKSLSQQQADNMLNTQEAEQRRYSPSASGTL